MSERSSLGKAPFTASCCVVIAIFGTVSATSSRPLAFLLTLRCCDPDCVLSTSQLGALSACICHVALSPITLSYCIQYTLASHIKKNKRILQSYYCKLLGVTNANASAISISINQNVHEEWNVISAMQNRSLLVTLIHTAQSCSKLFLNARWIRK
ncbi:hypothetical protein V8E52_002104 [Russula decolorans]